MSNIFVVDSIDIDKACQKDKFLEENKSKVNCAS